MIPLIIKSKEKTIAKGYIEEYLKKNTISSLHLIEITPEKTSITIEQIRNIRKELYIGHEAVRSILFWNFDSATPEAQNALLKVLEEKNNSIQFILQVSNIDKILPTIQSRCRMIDLSVDTVYVVRPEVESAVNQVLTEKKYSALSLPILNPGSREDAQLLLKEIITSLRNKTQKGNTSLYPLIMKSFDILYKLEANNLNHQLSVDQWVILAIRT